MIEFWHATFPAQDLPRKPDIIFANPCKARSHLVEAVCKGVRMVTFDNATEVAKCAAVSKKIQLILRIITDDRGSQCRLSSKFGAPRNKWRPLLAAAKTHGLQVVGVSFHVGSGCRDAGRYHAALRDAREIFDMAHEYGMHNMHILDIGGGFPGETYSIWNPADIDEEVDEEIKQREGKQSPTNENADDERFMFFTEIAQEVAPVIDELFPENSGVRVIGEPGRYFVAASATLCCSVIASRNNGMDKNFEPEAINDKQVATAMDNMSRQEERELVRARGHSLTERELNDTVMLTIQEELADYSKLYASQQLAQQEVDVYNDSLDLFQEAKDENLGIDTATDMLGPPEPHQKHRRHLTVEGMAYPLVAAVDDEEEVEVGGLLTLAAAGEAAVSGVMMQAFADSAPLQDDFAYYINDGVYGGTSIQFCVFCVCHNMID
jgi:diaminopimelate decarboxylase